MTYGNCTLLESLFNELNETCIKEIFKKAPRIRKEFEKNGHTWKKIDEAKRKRLFDIIKNGKEYEDLFLCWYNKSKYVFLNDYFESSEYKKLNIKSGYVINNDDFWTRIKNSLSTESLHIDYFTNFSTIKFTDKQKKELDELRIAAVKKKSELEKNRITELEKENKSLKTKIEQLETEKDKTEKAKLDLTNKNSKIEKSTNELNEQIKHWKSEYDRIFKQEEQVGVEYRRLLAELEQGKAQAFKNYLDEEKKKHSQELEKFQQDFRDKRQKFEADEQAKHRALLNKIQQEKDKLGKEISDKEILLAELKSNIDELQSDVDALNDLKSAAINEYSEYVKNGQKWYDLINNSKHTETINLPQVSENRNTGISAIEKYNIYYQNIEINLDDEVEGKKLIFKEDRLNKVKKLFSTDTNYILCADSSWLSFDLFMQNSYSCIETSEFVETISLKEFFEIADANKHLNFKVIILSANRAPVECYLNPIFKAIKNRINLVYNKELLKIPENVYWFLQFDEDDYCAKTDNLNLGEF